MDDAEGGDEKRFIRDAQNGADGMNVDPGALIVRIRDAQDHERPGVAVPAAQSLGDVVQMDD